MDKYGSIIKSGLLKTSKRTSKPRSRKRTRSKKGSWGTWEQRLWQVGNPEHPFHN